MKIGNCTSVSRLLALTDLRPGAQRQASRTRRERRPLILKQRSTNDETSSSTLSSSSHRSFNRRGRISHQRRYRKPRVCRMCFSSIAVNFVLCAFIIYSLCLLSVIFCAHCSSLVALPDAGGWLENKRMNQWSIVGHHRLKVSGVKR